MAQPRQWWKKQLGLFIHRGKNLHVRRYVSFRKNTSKKQRLLKSERLQDNVPATFCWRQLHIIQATHSFNDLKKSVSSKIMKNMKHPVYKNTSLAHSIPIVYNKMANSQQKLKQNYL